MVSEIGSEFWDVPVWGKNNGFFPPNACWFISGTAALESIIHDILRAYPIKAVAIPSWCCNSMVIPFIKNNIEVKFYPVFMDKGVLTCDYRGISADCWLLLSYFGYTSQANIGNPSGIIIRDLTHSIFSEIKEDADYYFGSLRKWAGFYTGGYAWSDNWHVELSLDECDLSYVSLREKAMSQKRSYIEGKSESKAYLQLFEKGENFLDCCKPMRAYGADVDKAQHLDIQKIREQRRINASVLLDKLKPWAIFPELSENDCPLFVPILLEVEKRNALRDFLKNQQVFCPIHWPIEKEHVLNDKTKVLYQMEISIVCDQRYGEEDMRFILQKISESRIL